MRHHHRLVGLLLALLLAAPARAEEPAVVAKGKRLLGMHVSSAADGDFGRAYGHATSIGIDAVGLAVAWDEIEAQPGVFKSRWLPIANGFYGPRTMRVSLVLKVLDTTQVRLPKDLRGKAYDDPVVIARFQTFLTWVLGQVKDLRLTSLSLGNEVGGVLGADPKAWAAYTRLFEAGRTHIRTTHPKLPIGCTLTYGSLTGGTRTWASRLNLQADVILLTYYPLRAGFRLQPLKHLDEAFRTATTLYPNKPIHFGEIGCPSGTVMGSSLAHQDKFITRLFTLWDRYRARVPLVSYCWLTDTSAAAIERYKKYYRSSDPRFVDYLATLGLRTHAKGGTDKPAFKTLRAAAKARGF